MYRAAASPCWGKETGSGMTLCSKRSPTAENTEGGGAGGRKFQCAYKHSAQRCTKTQWRITKREKSIGNSTLQGQKQKSNMTRSKLRSQKFFRFCHLAWLQVMHLRGASTHTHTQQHSVDDSPSHHSVLKVINLNELSKAAWVVVVGCLSVPESLREKQEEEH